MKQFFRTIASPPVLLIVIAVFFCKRLFFEAGFKINTTDVIALTVLVFAIALRAFKTIKKSESKFH